MPELSDFSALATLALPRLRIFAPHLRAGPMPCSCSAPCSCRRPMSSQPLAFDHLFHGPAEPPTPSSSSVPNDSPSDVRTPSSTHPPSIQLREPSFPRRRQVRSMYAYISEPLEDDALPCFDGQKPSWSSASEARSSSHSRVRPLPPPPVRGRPASTASDKSPRLTQHFLPPFEPLPSPWSSLDAPPKWQPSPRSASSSSSLSSGDSSRTPKQRALPLPPDRPTLSRSKTSIDDFRTPIKSPTWSTSATEDAPRTPRTASLWLSRSPRPKREALQPAQSDASLSPSFALATPRQDTVHLSREHTVRRELPSLPPPAQAPATASVAPLTSFAQQQASSGLTRKRTISVDERNLRRRGIVAFRGLADVQEAPLHVERELPPIPLG
ncbi:hypothetical protein PENSPDRAFT_459053 [Peniophora sp. CONT]|nr:hypothetical protein PENSPDRAFT_459053 [Peniophora sp. CONT]